MMLCPNVVEIPLPNWIVWTVPDENVAEVVLTPAAMFVSVIVPPGAKVTCPQTSQVPAAIDRLVQFAAVAVVREVPVVVTLTG